MIWLSSGRIQTIFTAALLLLAQVGCRRHGDDHSPAAEVPLVKVRSPEKKSLERTIVQPGFTRPYEQSPIYARVQGYVGKVNVDRGYFVKEGTVLATVLVPELEKELHAKFARVKQAEAQREQAVEALAAASANVKTYHALILETAAAITEAKAKEQRWDSEYHRTRKIFEGGTFPKQIVDENEYQWKAALACVTQASAKKQFADASLIESQAKEKKAIADLEAAKANVDVALADRDKAQVWYDFREIRAPYDGVVTVPNVHPGQFLQVSSSGSTSKTAEPLFQFVNMDILRVVVQVPEYDATLVKAEGDSKTKKKGSGSPAEVTFHALNDLTISQPVTLTGDALDPQARTLSVEIHLKNDKTDDPTRPYKLLPYMYVNAAIKVEAERTWTLPLQAIYTDGEYSYCFIVEPAAEKHQAVKTALKLGLANNAEVQVLMRRRHADSDKQEWVTSRAMKLLSPATRSRCWTGKLCKSLRRNRREG